MKNIGMNPWLAKLKEAGCEVQEMNPRDDSIIYRVVAPHTSLTEDELSEIFDLVTESLSYLDKHRNVETR